MGEGSSIGVSYANTPEQYSRTAFSVKGPRAAIEDANCTWQILPNGFPDGWIVGANQPGN